MPTLIKCAVATAAMAAAALAADSAAACTTGTASTNIGAFSSYVVADTPQQGSGSAGLSCNVTLALLSVHYVRLRIDPTSFQLAGPDGLTIPFTASLTPGGAALTANSTYDLSSLSILSLFAGANSTVPIYFRTPATANLHAGTYKGAINLRWYYSVCSVAAVACLAHSNSPGLVRPLVTAPTVWGDGVPVTINVELTVQNDCVITAPDVPFGSAPVVGAFNPVTRTIIIRCTAGSAYSVGLNDGNNALGGVRRMRNGANYLSYELYKSPTSADRWGNVGPARRSSSGADLNPGTYNSATNQSYNYRAAVLPGQPTPPVGTYTDTIQLDVAF